MMKLKTGRLAFDIVLYKSYDFYSGQIRTLVVMATSCFVRLIMGKVEIGNFYCFIVDNRILFLQKSFLKSSPHFIRLLTELLNTIGCRSKIKSQFSKKVCFSRTISRLKVTYMFMVFATSYTPGIYADGYIVFAFPFVCSSVRMFVRSFVRGICVKVLR